MNTEKEINNVWDKLKSSSGKDQVEVFITYCDKLVKLKEEGKLTEEEAAYKIVGAIQFNNLSSMSECSDIFDLAITTEIPRTTSYKQVTHLWDAKMADIIKQKEWQELVMVIERANKIFKLS